MIVKKTFDVAVPTTKLSSCTAYDYLSVLLYVGTKNCLLICDKLCGTKLSQNVKNLPHVFCLFPINEGWTKI